MKHVLIAATALVLVAGGACAQSASNSGSNATATNSSASQSASVSNPQVNVIGNPIGNGASSSYSNSGASANTRSNSTASAVGNTSNVRNTIVVTGGTSGTSGTSGTTGAAGSTGAASASGSGDPTINYSGSYTVRNTPEVIPPSVVGGNTCAVGASAGVSLPGFGIAGGATWADKACERRQQAALMYNMGKQAVAYALMCQDDHVREAMREAGEPCLADRMAAAAAASASAAVAPAAMAPAPIVVAAAAPAHPMAPPEPKPAWCSAATTSPAHLATLSEGQRMYVRQNCGV